VSLIDLSRDYVGNALIDGYGGNRSILQLIRVIVYHEWVWILLIVGQDFSFSLVCGRDQKCRYRHRVN